MVEFDLKEIANWLDIKDGLLDAINVKITGFSQDSRKVQPGHLFFALKGQRVDGHDFLEEVKKKGAVAAVVSKDYTGNPSGLFCLAVQEPQKALHQLAKCVHQTRNPFVIAVTGSVGKTTTKEFIATLLENKFKVVKTPDNANSQISLPLSILNASKEQEVFVMEMGMSQPHEIEKLVAIAPPDIAVLTKVAFAHAAFFPGGLEFIAKAKAEIFSHPLTQCAIINHQALDFDALKKSQTKVKLSYSLAKDCLESDFILFQEDGFFYVKEKEGESLRFELPFHAFHLCEDFLGAAAVARKMGVEWEEIKLQAQKLTLVKNRFQQCEREGVVFLNDSYNANPTSMQAALLQLPQPSLGGRKIAVLGSMKELGSFSDECHLQVGTVALEQVDHLICLGEECQPIVDLFKSKGRHVEFYSHFFDVKQRVKELVRPGDVVLLKGSSSHQLWRILENAF